MKCTFDYSGTQVVVTGGTSGIGHAIARSFAESGATVLVTGTKTAVTEYDVDLGGLGFHTLDLGSSVSINSFTESVHAVDILLNNAGAVVTPPRSHTPDGFEGNIRVNLDSVFRISMNLRDKLKRKPGSIVNVGSIFGNVASANIPGYGASKAAHA